jgi:hypothetical protein
MLVCVTSCYDYLNTLLCESAFFVLVSRVAPSRRVTQPFFQSNLCALVTLMQTGAYPQIKGTINAYFYFTSQG